MPLPRGHGRIKGRDKNGHGPSGCPQHSEAEMPQLIVAVSFALSMGVLLLFLGMFLDYLHERRDARRKHQASS